MTHEAAVGDVFLVPVGDGRAAVGQIVGNYGSDTYYFALFDGTFPRDVGREKALKALEGPVNLLALSMDAKLHAGDWEVIGSAAVGATVVLPAYKEATRAGDSFDVVDHSGARRRPATATEIDALPYRKVIAPVRLEKALRASLGLDPWVDAYDELRVSGQPTTAELFG